MRRIWPALAVFLLIVCALPGPEARAGDTYAQLGTLAGSPDVVESSHNVAIKLDGAVADVTIGQTFTNRAKRDHTLIYRFPLPIEATVVGLTVKAGGKSAEALVVDATAAITPVEDPEGLAAAPDLALLRLVARTTTYAVYELRVTPVLAAEKVAVATRVVMPARFDGGRLSLRLPSRGGAANLAAPKVTVAVTAPSGVSGLAEVAGGGKVLARDVKGGKGTWSFGQPTGEDVVVEAALRFSATQPVVHSAAVPLEGGHGLYALSILVPPPKPQDVPHFDRVLFVVDASRSMGEDGLRAARTLVDQVLTALGGEVRFEAVLFGRRPTRLHGSFVAAGRDERRKLDRAIGDAVLDNGSDLGAALALVRPILAERTRDEQAIQKKTGARPATLVVLVSDGMTPIGLSADRAVDRYGGDLLDHAFVVSVTVYPDGSPAPGSEEPPAGQLAIRAGGRSLVIRDVDAASRGAELGVELTRPAPLRALTLDTGAALVDIDLPGELLPGQGAVVVGEYRSALPKKILLAGRLGGERIELEPRPVTGALGRIAAALWLGRVGPEAFVPLSQRPDEAPYDPASYRAGVWSEAERAYQTRAGMSGAVTPWTSLVALAPGDSYGQDRAQFVKKWGLRRFSRLPPVEERDGGPAPEVVKLERRALTDVAPTPRTYAPTGAIDEVIAKRLMQTYVVPQARACYLGALRTDPDAVGDIDLVVEMARGEVTTVSIAASTFKSAQVDLCVIDAAYGIQVPRVGIGTERDAIVVVRYPLHFRLAAREPKVTDDAPTAVDPGDPSRGGAPIPDGPDARRPQGE
jgi:hypothetical protein